MMMQQQQQQQQHQPLLFCCCCCFQTASSHFQTRQRSSNKLQQIPGQNRWSFEAPRS
jgi:hypothetical protein